MDTKKILVVNRCSGATLTRCTDADVEAMTLAIARQVREHVAPAYNAAAVDIQYLPRSAPAPTTVTEACIIQVQNTIDRDFAGYHAQRGAAPGDELMYGYVGVDRLLAGGAGVRTGKYSVAHILSHEVIETFIDPACNLWAATKTAGTMLKMEVCDPVQASNYLLDGITVANFVTWDWHNPFSAGPRFDYLGRLSGPMKIEAGGYATTSTGGKTSTQYGAAVPDFIREMKEAGNSRTGLARRTGQIQRRGWLRRHRGHQLEEQAEPRKGSLR